MKIYNFADKIANYKKTNPFLSHNQYGTLLVIDSIYEEIPTDLTIFKKLNTYLDPKYITTQKKDLTFLKLTQLNCSEEELKKRVNKYLNVKFSIQTTQNSSEKNNNKFLKKSKFVTKIIEEILEIGDFPEDIKYILKESEILKDKNLFELIQIYKKTDSKRVKFEILRKLGLIELLTRITKSFDNKDLDYSKKMLDLAIKKNLELKKIKSHNIYFWTNENETIEFEQNKTEAIKKYNLTKDKKEKLGLDVFPIQEILCDESITKQNNSLVLIETRNKLSKENKVYYTSFIEKMIRKNLEFPSQVHDIIGIRLVTKNQKDIPKLISEIESFLGGASSRKKEKDTTLHKFGKKKLSKYSSKNYFVWKAIYDIALPNPILEELEKLLNITNEKEIINEIKNRINYYLQKPKNTVVEIQVQDLTSYLLSISKESTTDHDKLKMNQIRSNSFYKIFPSEIYEEEIKKLKLKILCGKKNV